MAASDVGRAEEKVIILIKTKWKLIIDEGEYNSILNENAEIIRT